VPVEDLAAGRDDRSQCGLTDRRDRKPADLALAVRAHRRVERRRDELRAEADAEHVLSRLDRGADETLLGDEPRECGGLV